MAKLFRHLFQTQVLRDKLNLKDAAADTVDHLQAYSTKIPSHSQILMYRLPKQELLELSSLPCTSDEIAIKSAAKALR